MSEVQVESESMRVTTSNVARKEMSSPLAAGQLASIPGICTRLPADETLVHQFEKSSNRRRGQFLNTRKQIWWNGALRSFSGLIQNEKGRLLELVRTVKRDGKLLEITLQNTT